MNCNFSPVVFEEVKPYFDYIVKKMFPNRNFISSPAHNILFGTIEKDSFASFHYNYSLAMTGLSSGSSNNMSYETGVMIVSKELNLPEFEIDQKNIFQKAINYISIDSSQSTFLQKYEIKSSNQSAMQNILTQEICQIFETAQIIRSISNGNLLYLFFSRDVAQLPDVNQIQFQLNTLWQLKKILKNKKI